MSSPRPAMSMRSLLRWSCRRFLLSTGLAVAIGLGSLVPAYTADPSSGVRSVTPGKRRDEVVDVYEKVKAAVVNIHSERTVNTPADDPFSRAPVQPQRVNGMGTGIVLDPRGYILTNYHVVDDVHSLRVRLHDGSGYTARVIATDKEADLALMKIDPAKPLPVIGFGTSSDLMVGESVIAVGNAYGYEHTVTAGRVSFKGRDVSLNKDMGYKGLIQTSAPINPGNSGGPLLNVMGELVGVNVAIRAGAQNIGFALPVDFVVGRAADMISPRRRSGLRHGIIAKDNVTREETEKPAKRFVSIEAVESNSPAAAAGLRPGDVIERIDDVTVVTSIDLERSLLGKAAGAKIPMKVKRAGESDTELSLQLDAVTQTSNKVVVSNADQVWKRLGVKVMPVNAAAVAKANDALHGGLMLTEVAPGSVAATAGMVRGDILVGLHQWETLNVDNITFVLNHKDLASFLPLKFYVARDGKLKDGWITSIP